MSVIGTSLELNAQRKTNTYPSSTRKNLKFLNVPEGSIHSIYSKLAMRVFDVYIVKAVG
jgi:hypothetical protein